MSIIKSKAIQRGISAIAAAGIALCCAAGVSAAAETSSANTVVEAADGELLDIISVPVSEALGFDEKTEGIWYIGKGIYAFNFASGSRFFRITEEDIGNWRRTGKLNAVPVTVDKRLDGIKLTGNFLYCDLEETDYLILYLKDVYYIDEENQYRYILKYNNDNNSFDLVTSGTIDEINGVTKSGYAYCYKDEGDCVFGIYITDLSTGTVKRIALDYSQLGEDYCPRILIPSCVEDDMVLIYQIEYTEEPTGKNKGALWKLDVKAGKITKLEKHDTYVYNGSSKCVYYFYDDGEFGNFKAYRFDTGETYILDDLTIRFLDDETPYGLSSVGSVFYGDTVILEYSDIDQTQFAYCLTDLSENEWLTELYPNKIRNDFDRGADGSFLFMKDDKCLLFRSDGSIQAEFDDITDKGAEPYVLVKDNDDYFFIDDNNKRVSVKKENADYLGALYAGANALYRGEFEDGQELFLTWAEPGDVQAAASDVNPNTGVDDLAGLFAVMTASGFAVMITRKKK